MVQKPRVQTLTFNTSSRKDLFDMQKHRVSERRSMDRDPKREKPRASKVPSDEGSNFILTMIVGLCTFATITGLQLLTKESRTNVRSMPTVRSEATPDRQMPVLLRDGEDRQSPTAEAAGRVERRTTGAADLHTLVKAIAQVESSNDPSAIGDGGKAVGLLQIWSITVKDVNRIMGEDFYTDADRLDAGKSIEMFMVYSKFYAKHYNDWSAEGISRRWNGGPTGHKKEATLKYWKKVQKWLQ